MKGVTLPSPQGAECSGTSNFGYFLSRVPSFLDTTHYRRSLSSYLVAQRGAASCIPSPPALAAFSTTEVNKIAGFHHLQGDGHIQESVENVAHFTHILRAAQRRRSSGKRTGSMCQPYLCEQRDSCNLQMVQRSFTSRCILNISSLSLLASVN